MFSVNMSLILSCGTCDEKCCSCDHKYHGSHSRTHSLTPFTIQMTPRARKPAPALVCEHVSLCAWLLVLLCGHCLSVRVCFCACICLLFVGVSGCGACVCLADDSYVRICFSVSTIRLVACLVGWLVGWLCIVLAHITFAHSMRTPCADLHLGVEFVSVVSFSCMCV